MNNTLRISLALLLAASSHIALAGPCDTKENARSTVDAFDADFTAVTDAQKKRQKAVEAEIDVMKNKMVTSKRWTKEKSSMFLLEVMQAPAFSALEKQKMDIFSGFMESTMTFAELQKKGDFIKACPIANKMMASMTLIGGINDKEYGLMLDAAKKATK
jgi:hypothetical protein